LFPYAVKFRPANAIVNSNSKDAAAEKRNNEVEIKET
jgi:hypothetical protein